MKETATNVAANQVVTSADTNQQNEQKRPTFSYEQVIQSATE